MRQTWKEIQIGPRHIEIVTTGANHPYRDELHHHRRPGRSLESAPLPPPLLKKKERPFVEPLRNQQPRWPRNCSTPKLNIEMHKTVLSQSQQILALEVKVRDGEREVTTLKESTKTLEAKIKQQIDSNAAIAQTFRAQNVLNKNRSDDRLRILSQSFASMDEFVIDRHRIVSLEEASKTAAGRLEVIFGRLEERGNAMQQFYEIQQKHITELNKISRRLAGVERESDDYRKVIEIVASLENVQEDLNALSRVPPSIVAPPVQQVAETIFELSEGPTAQVSHSQPSHRSPPTDPVTPRIISEPIGLPTPIGNPLLPEYSPPDHPMRGASPPS